MWVPLIVGGAHVQRGTFKYQKTQCNSVNCTFLSMSSTSYSISPAPDTEKLVSVLVLLTASNFLVVYQDIIAEYLSQNEKLTPLDYCTDYPEMVDYLRNYGARLGSELFPKEVRIKQLVPSREGYTYESTQTCTSQVSLHFICHIHKHKHMILTGGRRRYCRGRRRRSRSG